MKHGPSSVDAILPTVQSPLIEPLPDHNGEGGGGDWFGFKGSALLGGFNIVCCVVGVGLLGLPFAVNQSGWIGVPLMLLTCAMATYTSYAIGRCMQMFPDLRTFGDIGYKAFGQWGKVAVNVQQHVTLIGVSAIFLIAMSSTVANVVDKSVYGSCRVLICVLTVVVWPHVFFHRYNEVAILSAFNILIAVFIAATVVVESLKSADASASHEWINTSKDSSGRTYQMLIAFPTIAFAFGCHPILPDIYLELKRPASYGRMVVMAFLVILCFYLPVAYAGYHAFGDKVQSPIFSNLAGTVVKVGEVALTMHVALSYGVVVNPSELALENLFYKCGGMGMYRHPNQIKFATRWIVRLLLRTALLGLSFGIAQGLPCFPDLLSLVSSVTVTFTSFMFPVAFYWRLCPMGGLERLWNVVIMVFAMVGCVTGTYNAIISFENCQPSSSGC